MRSIAKFSLGTFLLTVMAQPAMSDDEGSDWTDRIKLKGDIRIRYEGAREEGEVDRGRGRFRTRFGLSAVVSDDVKVVLQLASGGDNPVSTNQTFDGGFSTKDIGIDLAYVDWTAADGLHVYGGKMKNPLFRAGSVPMIWDSDFNPEGVAANYSSGIFFGTLGIFSAEERSSGDDSLLHAVQAGLKFGVGENASLTAGVGYLAYTDTIGNEPFYNGSPKGNSVDLNGNYVHEYRDTEVFAQFDTKLGDWPLKVYAHAVQNSEVSVEDRAYAVGAKIGAVKDKGTMQFSWTYQDIEADAVIGTFNDSDFGGGGADSSGHILDGKYALAKNINLVGTFFANEVDRFQGTAHDYDRIHLGFEFKFE